MSRVFSQRPSWGLLIRLTTVVLLLNILLSSLSFTNATKAASPWMDTSLSPAQRATLLLAAMTSAEKFSMVYGSGASSYVGHVPAITRLGIPELNLEDGPAGVGDGMTQVTAFPSPLTAAFTWDTNLMQQYGAATGGEERGKGANVHLSPMMNINRIPNAGRNFEGFGEDPYLTGSMAAADIKGIQSQGIIATAKHYIDNDQEYQRDSESSNIDDRTQHEIYLPPFKSSVQAGVGSVMCSYNKINTVYACENGTTQNNWLKNEIGFPGFIMSDWGATHSTNASALGGLDMQMPDGGFFGTPLQTAVSAGQVPQSRVDDMVKRILTSMFQVGLFDRAPDGSPSANVQTAAHTQLAKDITTQGTVLLKNSNNVLPLNTATVHSIAVIGSTASTNPIVVGGGSGGVNVPYTITPLQGITSRAGSGITVTYAQGDGSAGTPIAAQYLKSGSSTGLQGQYYNNTTLSGSPVLTRIDSNIDTVWGNASPGAGVNATNWSVRWTGTLTPPTTGNYVLTLTSDDGSRMYVNNSLLIDNWGDHGDQTQGASIQMTAGQAYNIEVDYYQAAGGSDAHFDWLTPSDGAFSAATTAASQSDVAVVVVGLASSEGSDRASLSLPGTQDALINAVTAANPHTIVVAYTPAQILMPWSGQAAAILLSSMPGQEEGNALASLLFGDANPSGKLPYTIAQNTSDYTANTTAQYPGINGQVAYSEGEGVGYRHFDSQNITPLYPFGYGLSYTTFNYSNFSVTPATASATTGTITVGVDVTNSGTRAGAEVAQLYLGDPVESSEPAKQLKGFQKVSLAAGQTQHLTFTLTPDQLAFWSAGSGSWVSYPGTYKVYVGSSSRDIRQTGTFQLQGGPLAGTTYQAETGTTLAGGAAVATNHANYTGTGFVGGYTAVGASTTFNVNVATAGSYGVTLRYANTGAANTLSIYVNGTKVKQTSLPYLANWDTWDFKTENLTLNAGNNTIAYKYDNGDSGNVNLDAIIVGTSSGTNPTPTPTATPVAPTPTPTPVAGGTNIALGKTATTSSTENGGTPASAAVDGNTGTRWSSAASDPQWLQVDLGATYSINKVVLNWETAYGKAYQIQTSNDATNWTTIYSTTTGAGGIETLNVSGSGRYIRMYGTARGTGYGYSLWEFQVFSGGTTPTPTPVPPTPTPTATPVAGGTNLSQGKTATASSTENGGTPASAAVDGDTGTRWSSAFSDPQWLQVDLGATHTINKVVLNWETAYATAYQIQTSNDGTTWTNIYSTTTSTGGVQTLNVSGSGRYVRMYGTARGTGYGYSLWEFQVFGS